MRTVINYLNPIAHLGEKRSPLLFPLLGTFFVAFLCELYVHTIVKNVPSIGTYAISMSLILVPYFSFRGGIKSGLVSTLGSILFFIYIIYDLHYTGRAYQSALDTIILLTIILLFLASTVGWLKQTIDRLLEQATNEKRRLQTIIQQLPVGVLITDSKGVLEQGNRQVDLILGQKMPAGFTFGRDTLAKVKVNGKALNPSSLPLTRALLTGRSISGKEMLYERRDGKEVYLRVSSAPVHSKSGKMIAAASIISDITSQKEAEARKDDFVNMASHELKTPITSMKLYVDSLMIRLKHSEDKKAQKILQGIKNQTDRLQELVNDLLDVSRLQTGKMAFAKEQFRLDTLIEETLEGLEGIANQQELSFAKKVRVTVSADRFRVYQVLTNLLTNAMKYSPAGGKIVVRIKRENRKALVSVQDFGIGIAKEQQKKIFERLYQVTGDKEKTFPGFGMGLYISKEIIRRHRGSIWVESEKGKGSTFFFSLPLAAEGSRKS